MEALEYKHDIEKLLAEGKNIQIKPQGYSMYPLFVPGRDEAVIRRADPSGCKRGDVVLYRRDMGILVIHRICKRDSRGFYMVGDNQTEIEGPLRGDQIKGIMTELIRKGSHIKTSNIRYRLYSRIWLRFRPIRPFFWFFSRNARRMMKIIKKDDGHDV